MAPVVVTWGQAEETVSKHPPAPDGVAVGGYDLVSYRTGKSPVKGSPEFSTAVDGLTYRFQTEKNRSLFLANPDHYLPAYGGWCATALAMGNLTPPDYGNFLVENDRLLFFEVTGFTNGRTYWRSNPEELREMADRNYSVLILGDEETSSN